MIKLSTAFVSRSLKDAIREARARQIIDKDIFDSLDFNSKLKSFTVAGDLTESSILRIQKVANNAIEAGQSWRDFKNSLTGDVLDNITAPQVVWENAINNSYQNSRFQTQQSLKSVRPFLKYKDFGDDRVRPAHRAMNGIVARQDSSFWKKNYPPNGHRCRCTAIALSQRQVRQQRLNVETEKEATRRIVSEQIQKGIPRSRVVIPQAELDFRGRFERDGTGAETFIDNVKGFKKDSFVSILLDSVIMLRSPLAQAKGIFQEQDVIELNKSQIRQFRSDLKGFKTDKSKFIDLDRDPTTFRDKDFYQTFSKKKVYGEIDLVPKIDIAAATLKKPLIVFRDFMRNKRSNETTVIEEYLSLTESARGAPVLVSLLLNRNVMIKLTTSLSFPEHLILNNLTGLAIFKKS